MNMEIIDQTITVLGRVEGLKLAIVYGSVATDTMRRGSVAWRFMS